MPLFIPFAAGGKFSQYKIMQKGWKMTETLANGYSSESTQRELSNEYQHDVLWMKVALALEGLYCICCKPVLTTMVLRLYIITYNPHVYYVLTLSMLRLLSAKEQGCKQFLKPSKPCHVGIHLIALAEYTQMSARVPGFQSFFRFFASFCIGQISHQHQKG